MYFLLEKLSVVVDNFEVLSLQSQTHCLLYGLQDLSDTQHSMILRGSEWGARYPVCASGGIAIFSGTTLRGRTLLNKTLHGGFRGRGV